MHKIEDERIRRSTWFIPQNEHDVLSTNILGLGGIDIEPRLSFFGEADGWSTAITKLMCLRKMVDEVHVLGTDRDDDIIVHLDSDAILWSTKVFDAMDGYDFAGFQHSERREVPEFGGLWGWYGGHFHAYRVGAVRKLAAIDRKEQARIKARLLELGLGHIDDVVMSFFMRTVTDKCLSLTGKHIESKPEACFRDRSKIRGSVTHLQPAGEFMGIPIGLKWDVPFAVREALKDSQEKP
jgi:hypothetical protein